jgi:hypothetical protein
MSIIEAPQIVLAHAVAEPPRAGASRTAYLLHASIWLAALGVLAAAALLEVRQRTTVVIPLLDYTLPELCYWRTMFDIDCPGCGLTRCFISAAHGQVSDGWRYNPIGLLMFATVVAQIPYRPWQLWRMRTGRGEFRSVELPYAMLGLSTLLIVQWLWRLMG